MPPPRRNDPAHQLRLAIHCAMALAVVFTIIAIALIYWKISTINSDSQMIDAGLLLLPPAVFLLISLILQRQRLWALTIAFATGGLMYVVLLLSLADVILQSLFNIGNSLITWQVMLVMFVIWPIALLLLAQFIMSVHGLLKSHKLVSLQNHRGFEPLPITPGPTPQPVQLIDSDLEK